MGREFGFYSGGPFRVQKGNQAIRSDLTAPEVVPWVGSKSGTAAGSTALQGSCRRWVLRRSHRSVSRRTEAVICSVSLWLAVLNSRAVRMPSLRLERAARED